MDWLLWVNTCHLLSYFKKNKLYQFSGYPKFSVVIQLATWEVFMLVKWLQFSIVLKYYVISAMNMHIA
jgi:hypothetical protein